MLLQAGAAILGIAFLVKAGMWPLGFWLPSAYMAAAAPVAAIFVGAHQGRCLRAAASIAAAFRQPGGRADRFRRHSPALGRHGDPRLRDVRRARLAGRWAGSPDTACSSPRGPCWRPSAWGRCGRSGALFYLVSSTLSTAASFMLIELVERAREPGADLLAVTMEAYGEEGDVAEEHEDEEVGVVMPERSPSSASASDASRSCSRACRPCQASSPSSPC